jgi:hypothetical protein
MEREGLGLREGERSFRRVGFDAFVFAIRVWGGKVGA